jgi:hypothetical protein
VVLAAPPPAVYTSSSLDAPCASNNLNARPSMRAMDSFDAKVQTSRRSQTDGTGKNLEWSQCTATMHSHTMSSSFSYPQRVSHI